VYSIVLLTWKGGGRLINKNTSGVGRGEGKKYQLKIKFYWKKNLSIL